MAKWVDVEIAIVDRTIKKQSRNYPKKILEIFGTYFVFFLITIVWGKNFFSESWTS